MVELAARAKPDAIVIDMQHGLWERAALEAAIGVTPAAVPVLVRVAENSAIAIGTALDAGAEGVIVPLVETAAQARAAVAAARYPPRGARSGGGIRPLAQFADYVAAAGGAIVVAVMIETNKGLQCPRHSGGCRGRPRVHRHVRIRTLRKHKCAGESRAELIPAYLDRHARSEPLRR